VDNLERGILSAAILLAALSPSSLRGDGGLRPLPPAPPPAERAVGPGGASPTVRVKVLLRSPAAEPYEGIVFLEIYLDESRPAAYRPQDVFVVPAKAVAGEIRIPVVQAALSIRRAFAPGLSTAVDDAPIPTIPGAALGRPLELLPDRSLKVFTARVVDAATGQPVPGARFFFDDRDHRTFDEQVAQRPDVRPQTVFHTATGGGEIILPTDEEPFGTQAAINLSIFHPDYVPIATAVRPLLRDAAGGRQSEPAVFRLEAGAVVAGRVGPRNAFSGAEQPHVRLSRIEAGGRKEVRVLLDPAGNFRLTGLPSGRYEMRFAHGLERIDARPGEAVRIDKE